MLPLNDRIHRVSYVDNSSAKPLQAASPYESMLDDLPDLDMSELEDWYPALTDCKAAAAAENITGSLTAWQQPSTAAESQIHVKAESFDGEHCRVQSTLPEWLQSKLSALGDLPSSAVLAGTAGFQQDKFSCLQAAKQSSLSHSERSSPAGLQINATPYSRQQHSTPCNLQPAPTASPQIINQIQTTAFTPSHGNGSHSTLLTNKASTVRKSLSVMAGEDRATGAHNFSMHPGQADWTQGTHVVKSTFKYFGAYLKYIYICH